jgi:hypothetical protein
MAAPGRITHPEGLRAELADVRRQYNTVRLDAGVGYVTPDDEHQGHGPRIRAARKTRATTRPLGTDHISSNPQSKANRRSSTDVD